MASHMNEVNGILNSMFSILRTRPKFMLEFVNQILFDLIENF